MNSFPTIAALKNSPLKLKKNYRFIVGIDPGTKTGIAIWDREQKKITSLYTMPLHKALEFINVLTKNNPTYNYLVRVEDARKRTWFGKKDKNGKWIQTGKERLKGAGSVERDCKIWQDFLTDNNIDFEMVHPKNNKTKLTADAFRKITGWKERTSVHARDSAILCFGF